MEKDWEIDVIQSSLMPGFQIRIYREIGNNEYQIMHFDAEGVANITTHKFGAMISPSMYLNHYLLKKLGEAIANIGVKLDADAKREGLLEATKYHLEDMRTLLKLNILGDKK